VTGVQTCALPICGDAVEKTRFHTGLPVTGVIGTEGAFSQSTQNTMQPVPAGGLQRRRGVPAGQAVTGDQLPKGGGSAEVTQFRGRDLSLGGHAHPYFPYSSEVNNSSK